MRVLGDGRYEVKQNEQHFQVQINDLRPAPEPRVPPDHTTRRLVEPAEPEGQPIHKVITQTVPPAHVDLSRHPDETPTQDQPTLDEAQFPNLANIELSPAADEQEPELTKNSLGSQ